MPDDKPDFTARVTSLTPELEQQAKVCEQIKRIGLRALWNPCHDQATAPWARDVLASLLARWWRTRSLWFARAHPSKV